MIFKVLLGFTFPILAIIAGVILYFKLTNGVNEKTLERTQQRYEIAVENKESESIIAKLKQGMEQAQKDYNKQKASCIIWLILVVVNAVGFIIVPWNFYTINPGEAAVVKHLGVATEVRTSGTYANFFMTDKIERYDTKVRNIDITEATYSNDAQTMDIQMTIQYSINPEHLVDIVNKYGDISMLESKIKSVAVEQTKAILSSYKAMDIIANRSEMSPLVSNAIKNTITSDYYVTISTVVLTNIDFTDAFEKAVEEKMIAEQKKLQAQYENETAIQKAAAEAEALRQKAEIEIEAAKKKAEAKLIEAEADKKAQAEVAKAEAIKMKYNAVEIARALGLEVAENYDEDGLLESYTVDYSSDTDGSKAKLVSTYLEYVVYLETWDGELPETLVTDGNATIMVTP